MTLSRLVYFSRNLLDSSQGARADQISDILAVSVAHNRRNDISSGLIFNRDWFAHVLEGGRTALTATFARIERDPRHAAPTMIEIKPIAARRFSLWSMAAAGASADTAELFKRFCGTEKFDPRPMSGELVCNLTAAVLHYQMHHRPAASASRWLSAWRNPDGYGRNDASENAAA
jgi:Sensors of blue-light using FAD